MLGSLGSAVTAKQGPLETAEGRLSTRLTRPAAERVRDELELALESEVAALSGAIHKLNVDVTTLHLH